LALEDSGWEQVTEYLDKVLDIDAGYRAKVEGNNKTTQEHIAEQERLEQERIAEEGRKEKERILGLAEIRKKCHVSKTYFR